MLILKVVLVLFFVVFTFGLIIVFVRSDHHEDTEEKGTGEAIYLSQYLKKGSSSEARNASKVRSLNGNTESYSGFLTVDEDHDSNLFFWYFPAEENSTKAPILVWLQGGPGLSSVYGLFLENGPHMIVTGDSVRNRQDYWSKYLHVIYLDCSVGTGFSYTRNESSYPTNGTSVASHLYTALKQFFIIFTELENKDVYLAGESYGGKYVPDLALFIHNSTENKINLKGLAIGNGLIDPIRQMIYSEYFQEISIIDNHQRNLFVQKQNHLINMMNKEKWLEAYFALSDLISRESGRGTLFSNTTGFKTYTNYLISDEPYIYGSVDKLTERDWLRRRIHVGNVTFTRYGRNLARRKLDHYLMTPSSQTLGQLMNNYRVLLYNGQLDLFLPYPGMENAVRNMTWCGSKQFHQTHRKSWLVDGYLAGYTKTVTPSSCNGSVTLALVRNAGHSVPRDQPVWALDLIRRFTLQIPYD